MRSWLFPPARRSTEATTEQLVAAGVVGGFGVDPIDGDSGYVQVGQGPREVPIWTLEKARAYSIAAYRLNPMARAIIDTYTSFAVGDSGLTLVCSNPQVKEEADRFWNDPRNGLDQQELRLRTHMLNGESIYEMLVGAVSGVTRFSPIDPVRLTGVELDRGNPLWPKTLHIRDHLGDTNPLEVVQVDDLTGLRTGEAIFWASWKALETDRRGYPFLGPVLDYLDDYDNVLSNLVDRTALARYLVLDVTLEGADKQGVESFIRERGGSHVPRSGSVEVHNDKVKWEVKTADIGSLEDTNTAGALLTNVAGGAGLAKTWLAEPDGANRATSLSMAEPVRRRVSGVQRLWLGYVAELVRFAVDQAVVARRLPAEVSAADATGKGAIMVPAAQTVKIIGPEIAAADAQITAEILVNLSKSLTEMVVAKLLTPEAATVAAKRAWEQYMGIPYSAELDQPDGSKADELAGILDDVGPGGAQVSLKLA